MTAAPEPITEASRTVRAAVAGDLPALLALYAQLHPGVPGPDPEAARATWNRILTSAGITVFVAEAPGGCLAASCALTIVPNLTHGARPFGLIENVVTHAAHRRQGHGTAVLRAAARAAREAGCYKLSLATGSRQEATLRFYAAAGFACGTKTYFETRWP